MVCDGYQPHVIVCRSVWYVMLTVMLVYVGMCGM